MRTSEALSFVRGRHINGCEPSPVELSGGLGGGGDSQICGNDGISSKPVSRVKVVNGTQLNCHFRLMGFHRKKGWFKCLHLNKQIPTKVAYKTCPFLAYRSCQKVTPQVKAFQYLRFTVKKLRNDTTAEGVWEFFEKKGVVGQGSQPPSKKNQSSP